MTKPAWSYDALADVYATDMGQSMPFDDVGFYRRVCERHAGRALELGCGTGRILLELLASGVDAIGIDRSLPMLRRLQRDATARGIAAPRVAQMDLGALALGGEFAAILAPYSVITYVTDIDVARAVLDGLHRLLAPEGVVVIDAFVPRRVDAFSDFRLDYRRPHARGTLEREKRIETHANGTNRIERRYRLFDADNSVVEEFVTAETIRPYSPDTLVRIAADAGYAIDDCVYDYETTRDRDGARFATLILRR